MLSRLEKVAFQFKQQNHKGKENNLGKRNENQRSTTAETQEEQD